MPISCFASPAHLRTATELSLIGPDGAIASVPATAVVGMPVELTVRIASHEPGAQAYRIVVSSDGRRVAGRDGIVVDDGASQDETIRFGLSTAGQGQVVRVELYRGEEAAPYRVLSLVFDVVQSGAIVARTRRVRLARRAFLGLARP